MKLIVIAQLFLSYKMADPGTIQLTKSGVTLITALVMIATLNQQVSKTQWMAITMQVLIDLPIALRLCN
jgi:hypothetical protein